MKLRLYLTNLINWNQTAWQGVYDMLSPAGVIEDDAQSFFANAACQSWAELSIRSYGMVLIDQPILTTDEEGKNVAVHARAWRRTMYRK